MLIAIATDAPRGAYHLAPLADALGESSSRFVHIVPFAEPVQGTPHIEVSACLTVIENCDRVVITGGVLSAWTEIVCRYAASLGKPVIFTELAFVHGAGPVTPRIPIKLATALSVDGANSVSTYLRMPEVVVTGTPSLDGLPPWRPVIGVPVIALSPNARLASVFSKRQAAAMSTHARSAVEVLDVINSVTNPDPLLVKAVVGPIGGASRRIVNLWTGPLPSTPN